MSQYFLHVGDLLLKRRNENVEVVSEQFFSSDELCDIWSIMHGIRIILINITPVFSLAAYIYIT